MPWRKTVSDWEEREKNIEMQKMVNESHFVSASAHMLYLLIAGTLNIYWNYALKEEKNSLGTLLKENKYNN